MCWLERDFNMRRALNFFLSPRKEEESMVLFGRSVRVKIDLHCIVPNCRNRQPSVSQAKPSPDE